MDIKVSKGWVYLSEPVDHPAVQPHGENFRFHLQPEVVASISHKVDLSGHLDVSFYRRWAKRLKKVPALKEAPPSNFTFDYYDPKFEPFPHQRLAAAFCLYLPGVALFSDKGTGKTYVALTVSEIRDQLDQTEKTLIIAPKTTLWTTWYEEAKKFTNLDPLIVHNQIGTFQWECPLCGKGVYDISRTHAQEHWRELNTYREMCGDDPKKRKNTTAEDFRDYIHCPKELEWNDLDGLEEKLHSDFDLFIACWGTVREHVDLFLEAGFDQVILDESTHIKTASSATSKAVHKLGHQARYRIAMTGTPIGNNVEDAWSQMYFVDQSLGPNVTDFRRRYLHRPAPNDYPDFWVPKHDGVSEEISERIDRRCLRISKDVLDLPDRHENIVQSDPLEGQLKRAYETMESDGYTYLEDPGVEVVTYNDLSKSQKLRQITNGYVHQSFPQQERESIPHLIDCYPPKMEATCDLLEKIEGKAIVWFAFRADLILLKFHLWYHGGDFAELHGGISGRAIDRNIRKFKNDQNCRFMIAHAKSAQFGHTWNVANHTIFYSYGYELLDYSQARDRNHRLGQGDEVNEWVIVGSEEDQKIYEHLVDCKETSDRFSNSKDFKTTWEHQR